MSHFSRVLSVLRGRFPLRVVAAALVAIAVATAGSPAMASSKYAAYVVDANSGKTLFASSADAPRFPASLTKMMTLYMVFNALNSGRISKSTRIPVSRRAASMAPSKLGLKPGQTISVEEAIYALVTKSANDAACAVGEFLGGSESGFAVKMTAKARAIGMASTTFRNASGLPDAGQKTTARDMATLGIALREHFPNYYGYFEARSFRYKGRRMSNHNKLLGRVAGVDGIKTGYTRASGFNLVSSVDKDGRKLVAVVMGGQSGRSRDAHMAGLIKQFLPKASRNTSRPLVASRKITTDEVATALALPRKDAPRPEGRPADETVVAAIAPEPELGPEDEPAAEAVEKVAKEAVPGKRPQVEVAASDAESESESQAEPDSNEVDPITTATPVPSGWVIQVASLPTQDEANKVLSRTKGAAGKVLASAQPFTETFEKGSATYFRARFGGFASKSEPQDACTALTRQNITCYAVAN